MWKTLKLYLFYLMFFCIVAYLTCVLIFLFMFHVDFQYTEGERPSYKSR